MKLLKALIRAILSIGLCSLVALIVTVACNILYLFISPTVVFIALIFILVILITISNYKKSER